MIGYWLSWFCCESSFLYNESRRIIDRSHFILFSNIARRTFVETLHNCLGKPPYCRRKQTVKKRTLSARFFICFLFSIHFYLFLSVTFYLFYPLLWAPLCGANKWLTRALCCNSGFVTITRFLDNICPLFIRWGGAGSPIGGRCHRLHLPFYLTGVPLASLRLL